MHRDMFKEELQKAVKFQSQWIELRQSIRATFNVAKEIVLDEAENPQLKSQHRLPLDNMHDTVLQ